MKLPSILTVQTVTILADGDGIDSNGNVTVKSGSLYVAQTSADNAAIDYDGTGIISGGTVWAIGNQGMAQAFTTGSSQSYIMLTFQVVQGTPSQSLIVLEMLLPQRQRRLHLEMWSLVPRV